MKIFFVFLVCFYFGNGYVDGGSILGALGVGNGASPLDKFSLSNLAGSGGDTIKGIVSNIPSIIPSPETMLQLTKNGLGGYPIEIMFKAINKFCKYFSYIYIWCRFSRWKCQMELVHISTFAFDFRFIYYFFSPRAITLTLLQSQNRLGS